MITPRTDPPTWSVDFTREGIDPTTWRVHTTKRADVHGVRFTPETVWRDAQGLHLRAYRAPGDGWYAAQLEARRSFTYGRVEVDALVYPGVTPGFQETLWLWPEDDLRYGAYPSAGEVDFAEFFSSSPGYVNPCLHYVFDPHTYDPANDVNVYTSHARYGDATVTHTWGVDWQPGVITCFVDDEVTLTDRYQSRLGGAAPFDEPFFLVMTQTVGRDRDAPTAYTPPSAQTIVRGVRVWEGVQ